MLFEFGQYKTDIDVEKTKHFYEKAEFVSKSCSCDGCLNFEKAIDILPNSVTKFFANIGVDMRKVCECYVNYTKDEKTLMYGGFYHLCGNLLEGKSAWKIIDDRTAYWSNDEAYAIDPNFHISFQKDIVLLEPDFPLPVIQLDFSASIPWVLEKKNTFI